LPDKRRHRGAHPEDERLFAADALPTLRRATSDLSWLLTRGYASPSALKLVGDRYCLMKRQRIAIGRCACSREALERRQRRLLEPPQLRHRQLWIDGYNVLTSLEAALAGGVILGAQDGCYRDMASVHGSYRKVSETVPAIQLLGELMARWGVAECRWFLDSPVSNSGRLKAVVLEVAAQSDWPWRVELVHDPDAVLSQTDQVVASSDSVILDRCQRWLNLARLAIAERAPQANVADLSAEA
jgi:hypothetical protein